MKNTKLFLTLGAIGFITAGAAVFAYQEWFLEQERSQIQWTNQHRKMTTAWKRQQYNQKTKMKSQKNAGSYLENLSTIQMTDEIKDWLILMREEEKLARDVYTKLAEIYNVRIFNNIAKSEQQHMDAIAKLLETYGIQDPIQNDTIGSFTNEKLKNLYVELLTQWQKSISDWMQVGIAIETLDINDLETYMQNIEKESDVYQVYKNLLQWSKNHLNAFQKQI